MIMEYERKKYKKMISSLPDGNKSDLDILSK